MEKYKRNAVFAKLNKFCHLANTHDYIEVTEWNNGEGFDVEINNKASVKRFQLTNGEFDAMKKLVKRINKK